jgi:hypothetical protein
VSHGHRRVTRGCPKGISRGCDLVGGALKWLLFHLSVGDPTIQDLIEWRDSRVITLLHQVQEAGHQVAGSRNIMQGLAEKAPASEAEPLDLAQT